MNIDWVFDYMKELLLHIFRYDNNVVGMFSKATSVLETNTEIPLLHEIYETIRCLGLASI